MFISILHRVKFRIIRKDSLEISTLILGGYHSGIALLLASQLQKTKQNRGTRDHLPLPLLLQVINLGTFLLSSAMNQKMEYSLLR